MPWGLYRFHQSSLPHFITFTCYRRQSFLSTPIVRDAFLKVLERTRLRYDFLIYGFVVMPNHVHLLISEPKQDTIATVIQSLKVSMVRHEKTHICQNKADMGHSARDTQNHLGGVLTNITFRLSFILLAFTTLIYGRTPTNSAPSVSISDATAYRLVFLTSCIHFQDTSIEAAAHAAHLSAMAINNAEEILAHFCTEYDSLVSDYNKSLTPEVDDGSQALLLSRIDQLLNSTISALKAYNSDDWQTIDQAVKNEKAHMGVRSPMDGAMSPLSRQAAEAPGAVTPADLTGTIGGYTYYVAYSTSGLNAYQTVLIDGTWSGMGCVWDQYHGQWQPPGCPAMHSPNITNMIGTYGGTSYGGSVLYNTYLSFQTTTIAPIVGGDSPQPIIYDAFGSANVYCSVALGYIASWSWRQHLLAAFTKTKSIVPGVCHYTESWCTAETTPPLVDVQEINVSSCDTDYHWTITLCTDPNRDYHFTSCLFKDSLGRANGFTYGSSSINRGACTPYSLYH